MNAGRGLLGHKNSCKSDQRAATLAQGWLH